MDKYQLSARLQAITGTIDGLCTQLESLSDVDPSFRDQLNDLFSQITDYEMAYHTLEAIDQQQNAQRDAVTQALYEANEHLRIIFDSIKDHAVFTLDLDLRVTSWNPGAERVFGWAEREIIGQPGAVVFTPEDRENGQPEKEARQALETGSAEDKRWHLRKDGSRFFANGTMRQLQAPDGSLRGLVKVTQDATADLIRQEAEAALRESYLKQQGLAEAVEVERSRLAAVLEHLPVGIWITNAEGRVISTNRRAAEIWTGDIPASETVTQYAEYRTWWVGSSEELKPEDQPLAQVLSTHEPVLDVEMRIQRFDGTFGIILAAAIPILDEQGNLLGAVGISQDITERKQAEEELRTSQLRQSFLLKLSDALRPLADPIAIQETATRVLGEELKVQRALYVELANDENTLTIERDYHAADVVSIMGRYRLDDFGPSMMAELRAGRTLSVVDVRDQPVFNSQELSSYAAMNVLAHITVPLVKEGRLVALLTLHNADRREWTSNELNLVEETAERTWAAVELARAEAARAQQERRTTEILETIGDVFYAVDENFQLTYLNRRAEEAWGKHREDLLGKEIWSVFPQAIGSESYQRHLQVMKNRVAAQFETFSPVVRHWIEISIYPREGGGLAVYFHDITGRKQAELDERKRRMLAEALRDAANDLNSTLELEEVLAQGMISARRLLDYDASYIVLVDDDVPIDFQSDGLTEDENALLDAWHRQFTALDDASIYKVTAANEQITMINDQEQAEALLPIRPLYSLSVIPLVREQGTLGYLVLLNGQSNERTEPDVTTLQAFSYQLVTAISNARLFVQAQELAAYQERQRLARDLHDAVSQTLFTASIMLESLLRRQEQGSDPSAQNLLDIHRLIKGGQAEMRSLLLELRPANVQSTPLTGLLRQLVDAVKGRKRMEISLAFEGEPVLPPLVHIAIYRIAQEALNNITKHANARDAWLSGRGDTGFIELKIHDNGAGFDMTNPKSGLGLQIMRERAAEIDAVLEIRSVPGDGTEINLRWPKPSTTEQP